MTMNKIKFEKFHKIIEQIEKSKGFKINDASRLLEISFKLMVINFIHVDKFIERVPIFSKSQRNDSEKFQIEALRRFLNFLNSAIAFKEHTRKYVSDIYGDSQSTFNRTYQSKVNAEFASDPLTQFIEALRNIYNHQQILPLGIETIIKNNELVSRVKLFKKQLEEYENLPSKANIYLSSIPDELNIDALEICEDYLNKSLFPWLMTQQISIHKEEFEKLKKLRIRAHELLEK